MANSSKRLYIVTINNFFVYFIQIIYCIDNLKENSWYEKDRFYYRSQHENDLIYNGEYTISIDDSTLNKFFSGSTVYLTVRNTDRNNPVNGYITQIATAITDVNSPLAIRFRSGGISKKWTPWKYLKFDPNFM